MPAYLLEQAIGDTGTTTGSIDFSIYGGVAFSEPEQAAAYHWRALSSYSMVSVRVYGRKANSPADELQCKVVSGTDPAGSVLATAALVPASSIGTTDGDILFNFASPVSLVSGDDYTFVFERTGARDTSNFYTIKAEGFGTDIPNAGMNRRDNGSWVGTYESNEATRFRTFTNSVDRYLLEDGSGVLLMEVDDAVPRRSIYQQILVQ